MPRIRLSFPEPALFSTELAVRIGDLNYGNHLGHDTLVTLLHEARVRFFAHNGLLEWNVDGLAMMVVDLAVTYHNEMLHGHTLTVEIAADDVGARSCDLLYRVTRGGTLTALAKTRVVFVAREQGKVQPLPDSFLAAIS